MLWCGRGLEGRTWDEMPESPDSSEETSILIVLIECIFFFVLFIGIVERDYLNIMEALSFEQIYEFFLLAFVYVDYDCSCYPLDRVLAALPNQPILLAFM